VLRELCKLILNNDLKKRAKGVEPSTFTLARSQYIVGKGISTSTLTTIGITQRRISAERLCHSEDAGFSLPDEVIRGWQNLSEALKAGIIAIVRCGTQKAGRNQLDKSTTRAHNP
jgi:hypothetical protein